ncbi:NAD(P)H-nitrite reductase [Syntrophotalea acetylenivorans]|uniref:NAD(P)H-nitrite reductase n=1 Tax=Syntrophotalea acetylenivorans TaxID=1842532 RepID=A0A1L3GSE3_9BACT|nr:(2Fe-2S)-binding protein [Syntrophotalea acetylenivorans]APG28837.1 NAD(P)H-nitrite reductase [Syntrophotalea acetylenivorans]
MTDKLICHCIGVTEDKIVQAIREGSHTLKSIRESTKACTGNRCKELNPKGRCCSDDIIAIIRREIGNDKDTNFCGKK